ncbi:MAG TPA: DUF2007 domain-containing protein [Muribaculum sp.]|jgi:hypothetical protein|uniref:DUF2007 domain-containing protein n=1 Tax=Heminiphilus faecis TaxID=2601703 RepID=A0ABV4CY06_9BACT|nr:DUF2007 domain-containing protein [Heminiphilus faecis]RLT75513.1 DUF2007 domain-containing protein [bacterium J10(2018)]HRF69629.1 DUF2007 domain-containing protein [Muribaculum sp.]
MKDSDLVVFGTYYSDADAYIAKGVLETNGVPCIINNEIMSTVYPITVTSLGEIKLLVFRRDLELARRIMEAKPLPDQDD